MMRIVIIGGGPAGLFTAYNLAKAGLSVDVYEEHKEIGVPIQCTGLVTTDILELLPDLEKSGAIVNTISRIRVNTAHKHMDVAAHEYVLDRTLFDQYIGKLAAAAGARLHRNHIFLGVAEGKLQIRDKEKDAVELIDYDILIGADGPLSRVSRTFFPKNKVPLYHGMQAVFTMKVDQHTYDTYLGDDYPEFFGWSVPQGPHHARVGLAAKKDARVYFDKLMVRLGLSEKDLVCWQAGPIPVFNPRNKIYVKSGAKHVFLVGDAAGQIKSTTGGGIIPHLRCGRFLSACIVSRRYKRYTNSLFYRHNLELYFHLFARNTLDAFSDSDYDKLVALMSRPSAKRALAETNRDQALLLMAKLFLRQPGLVSYAGKGMKGLMRTF